MPASSGAHVVPSDDGNEKDQEVWMTRWGMYE